MNQPHEMLTEKSVAAHLPPSTPLCVFPCLASTNDTAKELAMQGAPHGMLVTADRQSAGKGRLGRTFYSPAGSGIYMSVLLRIQEDAEAAALVTPAASVAVCRAIRALYGVECAIKWVNDVYLGGKKLCGILTESASRNGRLDYLIVGIGVNIANEEFPEELRPIATALEAHTASHVDRSALIGAIYKELLALVPVLSKREYLDEYRSRSMLLGSDIDVITPQSTEHGTALSIDENAHLIVRMESGEIRAIGSGEVSVRKR